jgi:hypothetical protein
MSGGTSNNVYIAIQILLVPRKNYGNELSQSGSRLDPITLLAFMIQFPVEYILYMLPWVAVLNTEYNLSGCILLWFL